MTNNKTINDITIHRISGKIHSGCLDSKKLLSVSALELKHHIHKVPENTPEYNLRGSISHKISQAPQNTYESPKILLQHISFTVLPPPPHTHTCAHTHTH